LIPAYLDETWRAVAREAGLAAEHIAFGATALGKANYAQLANYAQAFFSLSVGLERSCKLALLLDYAVDNSGQFPSESYVRRYSHGLERLMSEASNIAARRRYSSFLPNSTIHQNIINILSEFASNVTRYYNIDVLTRSGQANQPVDPIISWNTRVTALVLQAHYTDRIRTRHEERAQAVQFMMGPHSAVVHSTERGEAIDTMMSGALNTASAAFARRWERMYVLQLGRFLGGVLDKLSEEGQRQGMLIPYIGEIFGIFGSTDAMFRNRQVWSIY
jgi:hypothetical protein